MKYTYWKYQSHKSLQTTIIEISMLFNYGKGSIDAARFNIFGVESNLYPVEAEKRKQQNHERWETFTQTLFGRSLESTLSCLSRGQNPTRWR